MMGPYWQLAQGPKFPKAGPVQDIKKLVESPSTDGPNNISFQ